uniref:Nudix (nucleoside diphosphate linked moiety X)-type motif 3b n=1 Tax=Sinocyclocheilus anshuiensis TaxID=1608454 RepID=A0A671K761_9TELE
MMKLKSNQTRTYDGDGYKKRAACLCFRNETEQEVLLVSSSRYPDKWIVPGGGMEPEEEPSVAAAREVCEENILVRATLGFTSLSSVGQYTPAYLFFVLTGRKREWLKIKDAIEVLQCHKPVQATYFEALQEGCLNSNGTPLVATIGGDLSPTYSINQSSVSDIR